VSDDLSCSARLSRRSLLRAAVAANIGVTIRDATQNRAEAAPKISQRAVAYQDHPEGDKRCERCLQFQPPSACKMVDGTISPQGSCRIFVPIRGSMLIFPIA
jgi:hypothetical protein